MSEPAPTIRDVPPEIRARLKQAGQRLTPQRLLLLAIIARERGHFSVDRIHALLQVQPHQHAQRVQMSPSTIYRTLERLVDIGLLAKTDLGTGKHEYALIDAHPHHHLVCMRCDQQITFDDTLIEPLRTALATQYHFAARIDHLALFGLCAECEATEDATVQIG